jgi:MoxR-like ATPase
MNKIAAIRKELNARFMNRAEIIDGMLTALIAKENLFMIGLPGTGKSALTEALCSALVGGNNFTYLLSKFTTPEELYGPVSLLGLQKDTHERITAGRLPEAHVALLDEVFKGSSAILNTLLPVMNERKFYNGTKAMALPLQVLFGASNEIPEAEELAAMYDRFALKYVTTRLSSDDDARALFTRSKFGPMPTISFQELETEQAAAAALSLPEAVIDALVAIRRDIDQEGMYVSDRKWVQSVRVIKAYAYLQGHSEVELEDLDVLEHMLWTTPDSKRAVAKIVAKHNNPIGEKLSKITDAIAEIGTNFDAMTTAQAAEVASKLKKLKGDLAELGNPAKNNKLAAALRDTDKLLRDVLAKKLGLSV